MVIALIVLNAAPVQACTLAWPLQDSLLGRQGLLEARGVLWVSEDRWEVDSANSLGSKCFWEGECRLTQLCVGVLVFEVWHQSAGAWNPRQTCHLPRALERLFSQSNLERVC